jgi:hypothetical protein
VKKVVLLSEGDSAGSGSRISAAVNKYCKGIESICIVNRSRRKIGHFNPDFVLSESEVEIGDIQEIINDADVIHFKDDEPISRKWNGLVIPNETKIIHTAGGSSFRGNDFEIEEEEIIEEVKIDFGKKWRNQKRTFGRIIHANGESLQVDGSDYSSLSHNNVWSGAISLPKGANSLLISGEHLLVEEREGKGYDIRSIILRYFDGNGDVIVTKKKNTGSILRKKTEFGVIFPIVPSAESVKISFFSHRIYRTNYLISDLVIKFSNLAEWKYNRLVSQFNVANSTWPLDAYEIADVGTVLTPDLLHRERTRKITPHVKPKINKRKKKRKDGKIVIAHAPSNTGKKGTREFVIPAINYLKDKFEIEFNLIQGVSHEECIEMISKSDIFIDQMVAGYYGNAGLEAMVMGIPVLAYVSDETISMAGKEWEEIPIIRASELSIESVIGSLENVLENPESLERIGRECKEWVKKIHSDKRIAKMWEGLYLGDYDGSIVEKNGEVGILNNSPKESVQNREYLLRGGGTWKIPQKDVSKKISIEIEVGREDGQNSKAHISGLDGDFNDSTIEIFRIGWYSGKGARLVHRRKMGSEDLTSEESEGIGQYSFSTNDWHPGCYRVIFRHPNDGSAVTHFLFHKKTIESRNLIIFPKISCSIWSDYNESKRDDLYAGRNFEEGGILNTITIPRDLGGLENHKISDWLIRTVNWMEKRRVDYSIVSDVDIGEIEFAGEGALIFIGENRFWTPEIHRFVKNSVKNEGRDLLILGSGIGEKIAYSEKGSLEVIFPFNKEVFATSSSIKNPIFLGSFIETNRKFSEYSEGSSEKVFVINSVVDNYKKDLNFTKKIFSIDGEEFGEISSRHFLLGGGTHYFHGGVMDFPRIFLGEEENGNASPSKEIEDLIIKIVNPISPLFDEVEDRKKIFLDRWSEFPFLKRDMGERPTICLVSAFWKRPTLTNKIFAHYNLLREDVANDIDLINIAVGSEGVKSRRIAERNGFKYLEHENLPLSKKWDSGVAFTRQFEPDAIIIVGSDDIIDANLLISLIKKIDQGRLVVGIQDLYIYDKSGKTLNYWPGYGEEDHRNGETIGLSRMISRNLLERVDFSLWPNLEIDRSLDLSMTNRFIDLGLMPKHHSEEEFFQINGISVSNAHTGFKMGELGGVGIDVKTGTNITPLDSYDLVEIRNDRKIYSIIESVFR